jgi:hypothetical protein
MRERAPLIDLLRGTIEVLSCAVFSGPGWGWRNTQLLS